MWSHSWISEPQGPPPRAVSEAGPEGRGPCRGSPTTGVTEGLDAKP